MASARELPLDLRDVAVWLDILEGGMFGEVLAAVNYAHDETLLSGLLVQCDEPELRRMLRAEGKRCLTALGYEFAPTGGDVYSVSAARRNGLSAHAKVSMIARIKAALNGEEFGPPIVLDPPPRWPTADEPPQDAFDDDF